MSTRKKKKSPKKSCRWVLVYRDRDGDLYRSILISREFRSRRAAEAYNRGIRRVPAFFKSSYHVARLTSKITY